MGIPNSHYNENFTSSSYKYKWKDTLKMDFLNKFRHLYSYFWNNLMKLIYKTYTTDVIYDTIHSVLIDLRC